MSLSFLTPELPRLTQRSPCGLLVWSWGSWKVATLLILHHSVGLRGPYQHHKAQSGDAEPSI